jgi:hypothetical protein
MNGVHPGKIVDGNCAFGYGGREVVVPAGNYQILTGRGFTWLRANNGFIPQNAVMGGHENGQPLFICRANYMGGEHPGKLVGQNCNFSYGGSELTRSNYEILVHPRA